MTSFVFTFMGCCCLLASSFAWNNKNNNNPFPCSLSARTTKIHVSRSKLFSSSTPATDDNVTAEEAPRPPLYLEEGLFAVQKPLGWTSQQVVSKIRWMLEQDAKARGAPDIRTKRRRPWMKVGHGGTLDPLATGVLVVGVGKGTKLLQQYLTGSKGYRASVELGFQTTTLDLDPKGEIVATKPFDHVTKEKIQEILPQFRGSIRQIPPIFSALKKDGKRLYELGRKGMTDEDVEIEPRQVQIHSLELLWNDDENDAGSIRFGLDVECGGGTYIRSLVRDIGFALDTVATMTTLERTKQGVFLLEHCLGAEESDWTPEHVWKAIISSQEILDSAVCDTKGLE